MNMPTLEISEWPLPSCPFQGDSVRVNRDALHAPLLDPCSGVDHHRYGFELPARVECVSRARKLAQDRLLCWGIGEDVTDTALLIVSELVTNAVVHSGSHLIFCELWNGVGQLRISVRDQGCAPTGPHVCQTKAAAERGRGLLLVEAVSSAWGAHAVQRGSGRIVWAEVAHTDGPYGAHFPGVDFVRDGSAGFTDRSEHTDPDRSGESAGRSRPDRPAGPDPSLAHAGRGERPRTEVVRVDHSRRVERRW
ncbi:ATP-binding protein [Streptomyces sp. CAU 1734]|uniref:ATP-binding protein n=1 Tax=Streptomyces sp. CAU 1734 TaxID=3140360 RepID=UPI003260E7FC